MSKSNSAFGDPAEVLAQVRAAFGQLELPTSGEIIGGGPSIQDAASSESIRAKLAGRSWDELEAEFLESACFSFCYLSATGYRYYLPALLKQCLAQWPSGRLVHSTVFGLLPSFFHLYYNRRDVDFEVQTSAFDDEQYAAVCSFLELAFNSDNYRYLAGQAVRWGWNRISHPVHQKVSDHYRAYYQYQWPEHSSPAIQKLIADIRAAFDAHAYPGHENLCGSDQGDEPAGYALEFRGQDWRHLHPDFLNHNYASLSFFTDAAFRYYLPAYLIADLHGETNANVVFHLTHGIAEPRKLDLDSLTLTDDVRAKIDEFKLLVHTVENDNTNWNEYAQSKFSGFSLPERKVIVAFLQHRALNDFDRGEIEQALANYWIPSLT